MKFLFASLVVASTLLLQVAPVFAANESRPSESFFENAWEEAGTTESSELTCKTSSTSIKTKKGVRLSDSDKKLVDLAVSALKKFKRTDVTTLLGSKNQAYISRESLNSLGILDSMSAGKLTRDEAIQKMKIAKKAKGEIVVDGNFIYYGGKAGWKVFEDADSANKIYSAISNDTFIAALERASFIFKNYANSEKLRSAVYQGTLSSDGTTSLLKPFMGENKAKEQVNAPTSLVITGDDHMHQYSVTAKVVVGGLFFTVKNQCSAKLKNVTIRIPSNATTIDAVSGKNELADLLSAL